MWFRKTIDLRTGVILRGNMLSEMRAYPDDALNIVYDAYPDGILCGCLVQQRQDAVLVTNGLIKFNGLIYRMPRDLDLSCQLRLWQEEGSLKPGEADYRIYFDKGENQTEYAVQTESLRLNIAALNAPFSGMTFAIFRSRRKIQTDRQIDLSYPRHFWEGNEEYGMRWNMLPCHYSLPGCVTFHPLIFEQLKTFIYRKALNRPLALAILGQLAQQPVTSLQFLDYAIDGKGVKFEDGAKFLSRLKKALLTKHVLAASGPEEPEIEEEDDSDGKLLP